LNTTQYSRGTDGYRAPELLHDEPRFNNKSDIFAFGCILFELLTGAKLFLSDWSIRDYGTVQGRAYYGPVVIELEECLALFVELASKHVTNSLINLCRSMLQARALSRPNASQATKVLSLCQLLGREILDDGQTKQRFLMVHHC
jgi:serine/threonine protein kinase